MPLDIKDPRTDQLARELAALTGESITVAARTAIEARLRRVRATAATHRSRVVLQDIIDRGRARQTLDERSDEEILGHDDDGLPS